MILTFFQNPPRVTADEPVPEEILAMALFSRLAWANVNGRNGVRFRASIERKTTSDGVEMPAILEIGDEI